MPQAEFLFEVGSELGEGPVWDSEAQALYWVDIQSHLIHRIRIRESGLRHDEFSPGAQVTALAQRSRGGWIVTTTDGFAWWDPARPSLESIARPEEGNRHIRFNDAAVDPGGRFWAGTMNQENSDRADGRLYRVDPDRSVHLVEEGFTICNGMAWSLDERTMYFTDTLRREILAFDYDTASGAISNRRVLVQIPEDQGLPDGLTIDEEGFLWSALWGGGKVVRIDPSGQIVEEVTLPVSLVTSCEFGGPDLDELFITTAWQGLSEDERDAQPQAGDLFRARPGVGGASARRFAG